MFRNHFTSNAAPEEGELVILGGGDRSTNAWSTSTGTTWRNHYTSLFALETSTLQLRETIYPSGQPSQSTQISGGNFLSGTWSVAFVSQGSHGTVSQVIARELRFSRLQSLPVRGFRRRRPLNANGTPYTGFPIYNDGRNNTPPLPGVMVDYILLGGFNAATNQQFDKSVLSGMFGAYDSLQPKRTLTHDTDNDTTSYIHNLPLFHPYPDSPKILGDCCAEHYLEYEKDDQGNITLGENGKPTILRDEIITFGGRTADRLTLTPHKIPFVLDFLRTRNFTRKTDNAKVEIEGVWVDPEEEETYPPQPNPRWSAASVLIFATSRPISTGTGNGSG
jgi:hypothetical protein